MGRPFTWGQGLPRAVPRPAWPGCGDRPTVCVSCSCLARRLPLRRDALRSAYCCGRGPRAPRPAPAFWGGAPRRPRGSIPGSVYPICRKRDTCSTSRRPADALIGGPSLQIMAQRRAVLPAHPGRPLPLPPAVGVAARCVWERPLLFRYHITGIWQNQGRGGRTAARRIFAQKERGASPSCFLQAIYFAAASALPNSWPL